ncbi:cytochrome c oxidase subunit 3 family protein [Noviherbaspirillum sp.]|uniref:cytochrome c oxidase subunit 3 family protein n=1 Tax=Noviherbaspirillum sp. TaxID=1926288 RepID=UPI002B4A2C8C|nr:cytochrome c oxidase subunit 3 family protein [Noviherbaspirillum sp.]HJV83546.1 cytochrome c oxidase subunit 3 family protein [Noviherbaspirillum sp.]
MDATLSPYASQPARRELPGDLAMWCFILAELLVFGIFFLAYAFARARNVELFNASQLELNRVSGLINTLLLVTSSYFVVRAVEAIRRDRHRICARWLAAAMILGSAFMVLKLIEFGTKVSDGISMSTNTFYMFYLFLGFFHFMHVLLGMVILGAVALKARRGEYSAAEHAGVETGASYWHMVDLVWIVLFPLIYVLH